MVMNLEKSKPHHFCNRVTLSSFSFRGWLDEKMMRMWLGYDKDAIVLLFYSQNAKSCFFLNYGRPKIAKFQKS